MLEYLTEELHSHLYLKSLYTESRWKAHTPQQTDRKLGFDLRSCNTTLMSSTSAVPTVYVEHTSRSIFDLNGPGFAADSEASGKGRPTRLAAYLKRLAQKPAFTRNIDEAIDDSISDVALVKAPSDTAADAAGGQNITRSGSLASISSASGVPPPQQSKAPTQNGHIESTDKKGSPEQDSFAYIESILESLAYLGKLGIAIDSVLQRNPLEIYNLVESTALEVDERYVMLALQQLSILESR